MRAVDVTRARCNFRRYPIPVDRAHAPVALTRAALLLTAIACIAAGAALGVIGYGWLAQKGLLP
jgi:hypothetical protein